MTVNPEGRRRFRPQDKGAEHEDTPDAAPTTGCVVRSVGGQRRGNPPRGQQHRRGRVPASGGAVASPASGGANPVVRINDGLVRGTTAGPVDEFLGLPYAAPPTGSLRWRPPAPAASWAGVRDATQFGPSCPQQPSPFAPPGPMSEDCLYLNVYAPARGG